MRDVHIANRVTSIPERFVHAEPDNAILSPSGTPFLLALFLWLMPHIYGSTPTAELVHDETMNGSDSQSVKRSNNEIQEPGHCEEKMLSIEHPLETCMVNLGTFQGGARHPIRILEV